MYFRRIVNPNGHLSERIREGARPEALHCVRVVPTGHLSEQKPL